MDRSKTAKRGRGRARKDPVVRTRKQKEKKKVTKKHIEEVFYNKRFIETAVGRGLVRALDKARDSTSISEEAIETIKTQFCITFADVLTQDLSEAKAVGDLDYYNMFNSEIMIKAKNVCKLDPNRAIDELKIYAVEEPKKKEAK